MASFAKFLKEEADRPSVDPSLIYKKLYLNINQRTGANDLASFFLEALTLAALKEFMIKERGAPVLSDKSDKDLLMDSFEKIVDVVVERLKMVKDDDVVELASEALKNLMKDELK